MHKLISTAAFLAASSLTAGAAQADEVASLFCRGLIDGVTHDAQVSLSTAAGGYRLRVARPDMRTCSGAATEWEANDGQVSYEIDCGDDRFTLTNDGEGTWSLVRSFLIGNHRWSIEHDCR